MEDEALNKIIENCLDCTKSAYDRGQPFALEQYLEFGSIVFFLKPGESELVVKTMAQAGLIAPQAWFGQDVVSAVLEHDNLVTLTKIGLKVCNEGGWLAHLAKEEEKVAERRLVEEARNQNRVMTEAARESATAAKISANRALHSNITNIISAFGTIASAFVAYMALSQSNDKDVEFMKLNSDLQGLRARIERIDSLTTVSRGETERRIAMIDSLLLKTTKTR